MAVWPCPAAEKQNAIGFDRDIDGRVGNRPCRLGHGWQNWPQLGVPRVISTMNVDNSKARNIAAVVISNQTYAIKCRNTIGYLQLS